MKLIFSEGPKELAFINEQQQEIIFIYQEPTVDQKIQYGSAASILFRGKQPEDVSIEDLSKLQFQFGLEILTGFRLTGIETNISSDPESPAFHPDWKNLISQRMPDLVMILARHAFGMEGFSPEKN